MEILPLEITTLAHGGDGIGRLENGRVCFVPQALPGDTINVRITRTTKNAAWGEIEDVVTPSPHRRQPECPRFGRCGVCTWNHFAYPAQAEWKQQIVREQLAKIAKVDVPLAWREEPSLRLGYRTRAEFHGDGERLGFFARGSHDVVDTENCPLCHPRINEQLPYLREANIKGSVTVTVNPEGGEVLVWTRFPKRKLKERFPLAQTPKDDPPRARFLFDGIPVVNGTFSQASLLLNRLLIDEVHAQIGGAVSVLDLYCGSGNLTLTLPEGVTVRGVDHNKAATKAAYRERPGSYESGGDEKMQRLIAQDEWDTIVLDPPRTGAKELVPALAQCKARAIVYVSCDAATFARDLAALAEGGWRIERATALDLFPNTHHVETVCRLVR